MKNKKRFMIIVLILVSIVNLILIVKIVKLNKKNNSINNQSISSIQTKSEDEIELEKLKKMTERDRMEFYFYKFISYIKGGDYEKAYDLLYPEFKENYFKTQEEFTNYVKKTYPKTVGFSYNDIDRQGEIYVLLVDVMDTNKKVTNKKSQRVVIKENNFNDFVLSFQII